MTKPKRKEEAVGHIEEIVADDLRHQRATVSGSNASEDEQLIGIFTDGIPSLHGNAVDKIRKIGWEISGFTRSIEDGDDVGMNIWFRPIYE